MTEYLFGVLACFALLPFFLILTRFYTKTVSEETPKKLKRNEVFLAVISTSLSWIAVVAIVLLMLVLSIIILIESNWWNEEI